MAGWTERKQALHDMTASCLVVSRSDRPVPGWATGLVVAIFIGLPLLGMLAAIAIPHIRTTQSARRLWLG